MLLALLFVTVALAASPPFQPPSAAEVHDLFFQLPDLSHFQNGEYAKQPRLFAFCRHSRTYPCLLILKDRDDQPVREGGALWTLPALTLSMWGLPHHRCGGDTPQGVLLMNGVVPQPTVPENYGRFRRLMLDFVPSLAGEAQLKQALPAESQGSAWWQEAVVARNAGRGDLRIHGSGGTGSDPSTSYFPLAPSAGCVTVREGLYDGVNYADQRLLLDHLMVASGLEAKYENEPSIRGLLYLIEIDDGSGAVSRSDLARYGIQ